ncbi:MAG TPA: response regulator transcription factor [Thermoleophilaceae bacterium]|nr:response regulator transcription factor [Thermoleophilaceae bacterium]
MFLTRPQTRVAIAEGHALVRGAITALLDAEEDITVVGVAADSQEAFAIAERERPDVVLIDLELPGAEGLEATRRIFSNPVLEDVNVIVLSPTDEDDQLFGALRAGASGFLVKDTEPAELLDAVRAVSRGEALLSRGATRRLIAEVASQSDRYRPSPEELDELTAREREVTALVARGLSNQEIAERLVITHATAKTHVSRALRKVDARDRAQLVALAYETGLVHPRRDGILPAAAGQVAPRLAMVG